MKYDDDYKYMISGYYGIESLDEYERKLYILHDVKKHIDNYLKYNRVDGFDYEKLNEDIKNNTPIDHKLADALILLNQINGPMDLVILIKRKIKEMHYKH